MENPAQQVNVRVLQTTQDQGRDEDPQEASPPPPEIKPTLKRYLVLFLFCLNTGNKSFQWIQVAAMTTEASKFYQVENYVINATSIIFMVSFIALSWPACFAINRLGLRPVVLLASFGTAIGSIVKCFSCHPSGIWLLILAQVLVSLSEQLIYSAPTRLASVWFPDHQVSSAVAMCILGNQLGIALGFLMPHLFLGRSMTGHDTSGDLEVEHIGNAIYNLFLFTMVLSVVSLTLDYFLFDEQPKYAPGVARQQQLAVEMAANEQGRKSLGAELKTMLAQIADLFRNSHLLLLVVSFGIRYSIGDSVLTLLDQTIKPLWPDDTHLVGNIGCIVIVGSSVGLPLWGFLMDVHHRYKLLNILCSFMSIITLFAFAYILVEMPSKLGLYASAFWFGAFLAGSLVTSLEQAVELTYPKPEMITSSLMNISGPTTGVLFVLVGSFMVDNFSVWTMIGFYLMMLTVSLILLICSKETLNRQKMVDKSRQQG